ncbi:MAG: 2-amino-4-hydroxy-6-hydroxymethyldihydropteridine diphosphokinase [Moraxellaceae bacterium]|nr:2-amino-4-hydroxy-6-hydroxymethyldihydropteridine diphosphokinase [Moraxellaceae bacterium]
MLCQCYLGLGSNLANELGTPKEHIATAIARLSEHANISEVKTSSFYISKAYGVTDQADFINVVVACKTNLSPHKLLDVCQSLEKQAKRERLRHWGERSLDVDILLYGNKVVNTDNLTIPHIEICKRNFVLVPLAELAPNLKIQGKAIADMELSKSWQGLQLLNP